MGGAALVVIALILQWMLNPDIGVVNWSLRGAGLIDESIYWLATPSMAMLSTIALNVWKYTPFVTICVLARLQTIPLELYDAAKVDGAGPWASFRNVTLPMISPVLFYNVIIALIAAFQYFTQAYVVSNGRGDPDRATLFFNLDLYREAFGFYHMGYASAMAWLLFVIVLGLTIVLFKTAGSWVFAGGER